MIDLDKIKRCHEAGISCQEYVPEMISELEDLRKVVKLQAGIVQLQESIAKAEAIQKVVQCNS